MIDNPSKKIIKKEKLASGTPYWIHHCEEWVQQYCVQNRTYIVTVRFQQVQGNVLWYIYVDISKYVLAGCKFLITDPKFIDVINYKWIFID